MKLSIVLVSLLMVAASAWAGDPSSPLGMWKTIDDDTGKPRGLVEIYQQGDELQARILKGFPIPGKPEHATCDKCTGDRKGKPLIGMVIAWGLKQEGDTWRGGHILDPDSGVIYDAKLHLIEGGQKLEVRGFLAVSLFGRSQVWVRE